MIGSGWGVVMSCMAVVLRPRTLASLQCRDEKCTCDARRVVTEPGKTLLLAPSAKRNLRRWASHMEGKLQSYGSTKNVVRH